MKKKNENLPFATQRLLQLIEKEANGNVSEFSRLIGKSQQIINRLFCIDKRSGKYPSISNDIIQAVCSRFDLKQVFFITDDIYQNTLDVFSNPQIRELRTMGTREHEITPSTILEKGLGPSEQDDQLLYLLSNRIRTLDDIRESFRKEVEQVRAIRMELENELGEIRDLRAKLHDQFNNSQKEYTHLLAADSNL